jgi:hypothetical protein
MRTEQSIRPGSNVVLCVTAAARKVKGAMTLHSTPVENRDPVGLGTRLARRFEGRGLDFDIPEFRGHPIVAAPSSVV